MSPEPPEPPDTPNSSFEKPSAPDAVPEDLYTYRQRRSNHPTEKQASDGHEGEKSLDDISGEEMNFSLRATTKRSMYHKETGRSEYGYVGYSWTTLFWGPFPALFRGDFVTFISFIMIASILSLLTAGIGGFIAMVVWSFLYNDFYTSKLKRKGYEFQSDQEAQHQPSVEHRIEAAQDQPSEEHRIETGSPEPVSRAGGCVLVIILLPVFLFFAVQSLITGACNALTPGNGVFSCSNSGGSRSDGIRAFYLSTTWETAYIPDSVALSGRRVNNRYEGLFTSTYESGAKRAEANFVKGNLVGDVTVWYENGQIETRLDYGPAPGFFGRDEDEGTWTEWYENGQIRFESNFVRLEPKNGRLFLNPRSETGFTTTWYENGQKSEEYTNKVGATRAPGVMNQWYENGQKKFEGYHVGSGGGWDGPVISWHENGQKSQEANYANDVLVSEKSWDEDGNEL